MLKGLNAILGPELLYTLRAMGHGDEIALVDGNYPGLTDSKRLVRLDGHGVIAVLDAILSVLPIDDFVDEAIFRASVNGDLDVLHQVHVEMIDCCARYEPTRRVVPLAGQNFYPRVKAAHAVVQTSEPQLHGNIILRKGIVRPKD